MEATTGGTTKSGLPRSGHYQGRGGCQEALFNSWSGCTIALCCEFGQERTVSRKVS